MYLDACSILGSEVLRAFFLYAWKVKGLKPRDLGITPAYANMIKRGKRDVSKPLCEKLLQVLTAKDLLETLLALPPERAAVAQLAERRPGKAEVPGSNPGGGSTLIHIKLLAVLRGGYYMAAARSTTRRGAPQKRIEGTNGGDTQGEKMTIAVMWSKVTVKRGRKTYTYLRPRIQLPSEIVEKLGIRPGEEIRFEIALIDKNGEKLIVLKPVKR